MIVRTCPRLRIVPGRSVGLRKFPGRAHVGVPVYALFVLVLLVHIALIGAAFLCVLCLTCLCAFNRVVCALSAVRACIGVRVLVLILRLLLFVFASIVRGMQNEMLLRR